MRKDISHIERYRITEGPMGSDCRYGPNGVFKLPGGLRIIASDGEGWDHVSVSLKNRCPTWEEMCLVKDMFFESSECVVQFHPPKTNYVNKHPFCLHLWRKQGCEFELPPVEFV